MTSAAAIRVNQLLGRLAYFHILFIEPRLSATAPAPMANCCAHRQSLPLQPDTPDLMTIPWGVLPALAAGLGAWSCVAADVCCPTCVIRWSAGLVASTWLGTERSAYGYPEPVPGEHTALPIAAAHRISRAFQRQFDTRCPYTSIPGEFTPSVPAYPLLAELLELWTDPTAAAPVTSWLNHCGSLDDVARHQMRTPT